MVILPFQEQLETFLLLTTRGREVLLATRESVPGMELNLLWCSCDAWDSLTAKTSPTADVKSAEAEKLCSTVTISLSPFRPPKQALPLDRVYFYLLIPYPDLAGFWTCAFTLTFGSLDSQPSPGLVFWVCLLPIHSGPTAFFACASAAPAPTAWFFQPQPTPGIAHYCYLGDLM